VPLPSKPYPPTRADGYYLNRPALAKQRMLMRQAVRVFFEQQIVPVAQQIGLQLALAKVEDPDRQAGEAADKVQIDWRPLAEEMEPFLTAVAVAGGELALEQLDPRLVDDFGAGMRVRAERWARDRAAELVGMRREGDFYVPNPDPKFAISDATRNMLRAEVRKAIERGESTDQLARRLRNSYAFSDERARLIARTEIANADSAGALLGWAQSGVVDGKSWLTDPDPCPVCVGYAAIGVVALDYEYAPGVLAPTAHPNCECTLLPEVREEMETL
jgi:SPP1 gp7 family putative phage head morphogenesis protein